MQTVAPLGKFTPLVEDAPAPAGVQVYPWEYNERVTERFSYSPPPDPATQGGAHGDLQSRPARVQVVGFFHPYEYVMAERFVYTDVNLDPRVWIVPGRMEPFDQRMNIEIPQHVAYGSLFQSAQPTYGYG